MSAALVFWLVIAPISSGGGLTTIPVPYLTQADCESAAHEVNEDNKIPWNLRYVGLCVPQPSAPPNPKTGATP